MKSNKYVYVTIIIILITTILGYFLINSHNKKTDLEKKYEIEKKLSNLEINPSLEFYNGNTNTGGISNTGNTNTGDIDLNIPKRTISGFMKDERIKIMTFTNIKQCDDLKFLKNECRDNFLFELALKEKSVEICNEIYDKTKKISCLDEINNLNLNCSLITNNALKDKCNNTISEKNKLKENDELFSRSISEKNIDLCKKLSSYSQKEECAKEIILEKKDISLCEYIFSNLDEKKKCYDNISYDFNRYIINYVFKTKNLNFCDKIINSPELVKQCKSMKF